MDDTGLLKQPVRADLAAMIFGEHVTPDHAGELRLMSQIDRAHLCMLVRQGIVGRQTAGTLIAEIDALEREDFKPLIGMSQRRGLYLAYEDHLRQQCGADIGGSLQTARSRNDLNATMVCIRLRSPATNLVRAIGRLTATCVSTAHRFGATVMPAQTHYQAAFPITLGHYAGAVAAASARDLEMVVNAADGLDDCPLGACAGGGTTLPIAPDYTAFLLGFRRPVGNSLDAVASRDHAVRLLAAAAVHGMTLSRVAHDLQFWSSSDVGFIAFADDLVGSSSIMPQKRNPYLLEHVKGRSAAPAAALQGAILAMHATPFTNSIAVGSEAMIDIVPVLRKVTSATAILSAMIAGMRPNSARMRASGDSGAVTAAALAESWVRDRHMSFRDAHHGIGSMLRDAGADGGAEVLLPAMVDVVKQARYGGGPGEPLDVADIDRCRRTAGRTLRARRRREREGRLALRDAVHQLGAGG